MMNVVDKVVAKHDAVMANALAKLSRKHPAYDAQVRKIEAAAMKAKLADLKTLKANSLKIKSYEAKQVGQAATALIEKFELPYDKRLDKALEKAAKLLDKASTSDDLREFEVASEGLEVMFKAPGLSEAIGWAAHPDKANTLAQDVKAQLTRMENIRVGRLRPELRDVREHLRQVPKGLTTVQDHTRMIYVKAA
jgi:hypothetical protein